MDNFKEQKNPMDLAGELFEELDNLDNLVKEVENIVNQKNNTKPQE